MSTGPNWVSFDREKLNRLKAAYEEAKAKGIEHFEFEGNPILTTFAKYLIEYVETRLDAH